MISLRDLCLAKKQMADRMRAILCPFKQYLSYQDEWRAIMKGCMQERSVWIWTESCLQWNLNPQLCDPISSATTQSCRHFKMHTAYCLQTS